VQAGENYTAIAAELFKNPLPACMGSPKSQDCMMPMDNLLKTLKLTRVDPHV